MSVRRKIEPASPIAQGALTATQLKYLLKARQGAHRPWSKAQARTREALEAAGFITIDHYGCPVPTDAGSSVLGGIS